MKKRIKIDSSLLSAVIIFTGILFLFRDLYTRSILLDDFLDCLGMILIIKGNLFRMAARGHKKMHSAKSDSLVTGGPYAIVRNPMYLGSFMIGCGFLLLVWPWWTLPLFAWAFYARFKREVIKEEELLTKSFGDEYKKYCKAVPRLFPDWKKCKGLKPSSFFSFDEAFQTKEVRGLWSWPLFAIVLETFQEMLIFHAVDFYKTVMLFLITIIAFFVVFGISYLVRK